MGHFTTQINSLHLVGLCHWRLYSSSNALCFNSNYIWWNLFQVQASLHGIKVGKKRWSWRVPVRVQIPWPCPLLPANDDAGHYNSGHFSNCENGCQDQEYTASFLHCWCPTNVETPIQWRTVRKIFLYHSWSAIMSSVMPKARSSSWVWCMVRLYLHPQGTPRYYQASQCNWPSGLSSQLSGTTCTERLKGAISMPLSVLFHNRERPHDSHQIYVRPKPQYRAYDDRGIGTSGCTFHQGQAAWQACLCCQNSKDLQIAQQSICTTASGIHAV